MNSASDAVCRLLDLLDGVKETKSGWSALCPAHDDRNPSLSVAEGDAGCALVKCHTGCTAEEICAAVGLTTKDLFDKRGGRRRFDRPDSTERRPTDYASAHEAERVLENWIQKQHGSAWGIAKRHEYATAEGREIMRVLRFEGPNQPGKTFRPIHCIGGVWRIGDPRGSLPLYRLPEMLHAQRVYLCEGEKAADAAARLGLTVTTSAHGAGAAEKADWSPLAGKEVVILPDNDEPGRKYAQDVAARLVALRPPATVKIVKLPNLGRHGDVVDFIAARKAAGQDDHAAREAIVALADAAEPFVGSVSAGDGRAGDSRASVGSVSGSRGASASSRGPSGGSVSTPRGASVNSEATSGGSVSAARGDHEQFAAPRPLPDGLPPVQPFDVALLPEALRTWVADIAVRMQCPEDFVAVSAMVALASLVGRKVGIRPKRRDDWLVVPNLWGMVVGRPGVMKTPAIQEALKPLKRLEIKAKECFEERKKERAAKHLVAKEAAKLRQARVKKALQEGGDAHAVAAAGTKDEGDPPTRRRYLVNDATIEKLGELLNENPNGVLVFRDELIGFLKSLDKQGHESDRGFYLEAWNGDGRFTYDRIGRGTIDIEAATVSLLGSIQPSLLCDYLPRTIANQGDDGLISRFQLAVWPDPPPEWTNVDEWPDPEAKERAHAVFKRLDELAGYETATGRDGEMVFVRFDEEAQARFDGWREGLEELVRSDHEHPALQSHFAKYRSLVPSLALLAHLVDGGRGPVSLAAIEIALGWARYLESHARRIYSVVVSSDLQAARTLGSRIRRKEVEDGFTERDVYRRGWTGLSSTEDVSAAIEVLLDLDWLLAEDVRTGGRAKTMYRINPRIHELPQKGTDRTDGSGGQVEESPPEWTDRTDRSTTSSGAPSAAAPNGRPAEISASSPEGTDRTDGSQAENASPPPEATDRTDRSQVDSADTSPDGTDRTDESPDDGPPAPSEEGTERPGEEGRVA